jgi:type VII secretion protein EccE
VISGSMTAMIVAGVSALAWLLVGCGRSDGRWIYQALAARSALRGRRAIARQRTRDGHQAVDIQVHNHDDRGNVLGIGQDDSGWFAAVAVGGDDAPISPDPAAIPLDRLTRLLDEGSARPSALQIVTLRVSGTDASPAGSACAESYRELAQSLVGGTGGLAAELTWIAVRLDTRDALVATVERGGGLEGVAKALAAAVGRVVKLLAGAGVNYRVLDGEALLDALHTSCGFDPVATRGAALGEQWRGWRSGDLSQKSFEVRNWPSRPAADSLGQLMDAPAGRLVVSVSLRPDDTQLRVGTIVRVMSPPPALDATCQRVTDHAGRIGFQLRPLHGLHGPAILASAPTGGQPL